MGLIQRYPEPGSIKDEMIDWVGDGSDRICRNPSKGSYRQGSVQII